MKTYSMGHPLNALRSLGALAPWRFIRKARLDSIALCLSLAAVWTSAHSYLGIWHDGRLYALQALHRLFPGLYEKDLFLAFGSQDNYSAFPRIYAFLISRLGLNDATVLLLWVGYLFWAGALVVLARRLSSGSCLWLFLLLAFGLSNRYADFTFGYAENYLTPRIFAEGLVLLSLAALARRRYPAAFLFLLVAAPLHPLVVITGLVCTFYYLLLEDRRWLWLGMAGAAATLILALAGVAPFDGLLRQMDPEWYSITFESNRFLFVTRWELTHLSLLLADLGALTLAVYLTQGALRRLLLAVLLSAVSGVGLNLFGGDLLANLFILQAQFARTLWLAHLLACFGFAWMTVRLLEKKLSFASLLSLGWLAGARLCAGSPIISTLLSVGALLILPFQDRIESRLAGRRLFQTVLLLPVAVASASSAFVWFLSSKMELTVRTSVNSQDPAWLFAAYAVILPVALAWAAALWYFSQGLFKRPALGVGATVLSTILALASILLWDQRDSQTWTTERSDFQLQLMHSSKLPELRKEATILWDDEHINDLWFGFRHPSYVTFLQGAGMVFFRKTALEWQRRINQLQLINVAESIEERALRRTRLPDRSNFGQVCQDPALDYFVLDWSFEGGRRFSLRDRDFFLYDCREFRSPSRPGVLAVNQSKSAARSENDEQER